MSILPCAVNPAIRSEFPEQITRELADVLAKLFLRDTQCDSLSLSIQLGKIDKSAAQRPISLIDWVQGSDGELAHPPASMVGHGWGDPIC